jgi:hypothetical protein
LAEDAQTDRGVTFAPTWTEAGKWVRMADLPDHLPCRQFIKTGRLDCNIPPQPVRLCSGLVFRV